MDWFSAKFPFLYHAEFESDDEPFVWASRFKPDSLEGVVSMYVFVCKVVER